MVLVTDTYTDGSGAAAGSVVKGTVSFDVNGMVGVAPYISNDAVSYSGLLYNLGNTNDFDMSASVNLVAGKGPIGFWMCRDSSSSENKMIGIHVSAELTVSYILAPGFSWIDQGIGALAAGNHTVRITGKYTSGGTVLTLSIYHDGALKKAVPVSGSQALKGPWIGVFNQDLPGSRVKSFTYEDGTVAPPAGGSVKPSLNDAMYTWEYTSGPDNSHFSINDLLWANGNTTTAKGKSINDQLYKRFNSAATPHSTINDRIYAALKAEVGTVGKSQTINDLLYLKKKAGPPS